MPTNRELYFETIKKYPDLSQYSIKELLARSNGFSNVSDLLLRFDESHKNLNLFEEFVEQLHKDVPLQYIIHEAPFLDDVFYVDNRVLIPRIETSELVLKLIKRIEKNFNNKPLTIFDVCTGSGAIAIELKKKFLSSKTYASDLSYDAIDVAKLNAKNFAMDITFFQGDMLKPFINNKIKANIIISNPPYISNVSEIDGSVWQNEPHMALLANPDTFYYEEIFKDYEKCIEDKYILAFEIGYNMKESLELLVEKYFKDVNVNFEEDLYGKMRYMFIEKVN